VGETNQPYAFANDNPLNAVDPLGLMPSAGLIESDAVVKDIDIVYTTLEAQAATNRAIADYVNIESQTASADVSIHALWLEELAANLHGSPDAGALTREYNDAVAALHALLSPEVSTMIQLAYDAYSLYQSGINVARTGALGARLQSLATSADDTFSGDIATLSSSEAVGEVEVAEDIAFDFALEDAAVDGAEALAVFLDL
jgi:hypothetical protein